MNTDPLQLQRYLDPFDIKEINELQQASLAHYQKDRDIILLAPTGKGKTLGFFLPILPQLKKEVEEVQVIVLAPSRELVLQLEQVFKAMSTGFKVNSCYGGHAMKTELNNLNHPPAVLIGTPGRVADHLRRRTFRTDHIKTIILDEFDKSLEFGFEEDMAFIIRKLHNLSNRILTSATNMPQLPAFTGVNDPIMLNFLKDGLTPKLAYLTIGTTSAEKPEALFKLICTLGNESMLVFCNHREAVERISDLLEDRGIVHEIFHGGMDQDERERALVKFRNGSHHLLITTDLAARGLDIPGIEHIIHYQMPPKTDAFIHRNGRTARMDAKGTVYLIITERNEIPDYLNAEVRNLELPEEVAIPALPEWETLYISGGKKDKVNKIDIVGLLLRKGQLAKDQVGLIEVKDKFSYAAVARKISRDVVKKVNNQKVKKKKVRVQIAR